MCLGAEKSAQRAPTSQTGNFPTYCDSLPSSNSRNTRLLNIVGFLMITQMAKSLWHPEHGQILVISSFSSKSSLIDLQIEICPQIFEMFCWLRQTQMLALTQPCWWRSSPETVVHHKHLLSLGFSAFLLCRSSLALSSWTATAGRRSLTGQAHSQVVTMGFQLSRLCL